MFIRKARNGDGSLNKNLPHWLAYQEAFFINQLSLYAESFKNLINRELKEAEIIFLNKYFAQLLRKEPSPYSDILENVGKTSKQGLCGIGKFSKCNQL